MDEKSSSSLYDAQDTFCCPVCNEESEYEVLQEAQDLLVRCRTCGAVERIPRPEETPMTVKTIVSQYDTSRVCLTEVMQGEIYAVGDMLVAECGEDAVGVEVTAIEQKGRRVKKARAEEIDALWTRAVDQVVVKASVHEGRKTVPLYEVYPGDAIFVVGGKGYRFGKRSVSISHIKLREGGVLRKGGQKAAARDVKRIYGYRS